MATPTILLSRLNKINVNELVFETIESESDMLISSQIRQQKKGLDSFGEPFININTGVDEYSPSYAKKKGKKKPIDLHDKGDFQSSIFLEVKSDTFVIDSSDGKNEKLQMQFGGDIFGLNSETKIENKPQLQKALVKKFKQKLAK